MPVIERRRFPRLAFNVEVEYKVLEAEATEALASYSKDISAVGICIILLDKVDKGTLLDLKFFLPDLNRTIFAQGRVVWTEEFVVGDMKTGKAFEAGIEFTKLDDVDQETIKQFVMEKIMQRISENPVPRKPTNPC
jgi:c-di-GMP-binding flagellar brake protein YcgR